MPPKISRRAELFSQSEIRAMSLECELVGGINLAQGVCDTEVPLPVREAARRAIDEGINSYTRCDGFTELRRAIGKKMASFNGIEADPESEIVVSSGSTGAFYSACLALLDPGDAVIVFEPYYGYHVATLHAVQVEPVFVTLKAPEWSFAREDLERACRRPGVKGIVVNTPANPTGKVFSREELEWIAELACRHDLVVFTDEIYEYFVFDGREHLSPACVEGLADRTVTISGLSKTYSVTGWRVGYAICRADWAEMLGYLSDLVYVCAPAPFQVGVTAGLEELSTDFYRDLATEYEAKRDRFCETLRKAGLNPCVPQGAYYVLADSSRLEGSTSKEKAMGLLRGTGVASVPGEAFYQARPGQDCGKNLLRFCFAKTDEDLGAAAERLVAVR